MSRASYSNTDGLRIGIQLHPHSYRSASDPHGGIWGEELDALGYERAFEQLGHRVTVFTPQIQYFLERNGYESLEFDLVINFHADNPVTVVTEYAMLYYQEFFSRFVGGDIGARIEELRGDYDFVMTPAREAAEEFGIGYLPLAADESMYFPDRHCQARQGAVFIGRYDNRVDSDYDLFFGPCRSLGLRIYGGNKWKQHAVWSPYYVGLAGYCEARALYSGAAICISLHHPDLRKWGLVTSRVFHIAACQGVCISDEFPALRELFGDTLNYAHESADVASILSGLDGEPCLERACRGRDLILAKHTFRHRAQSVLDTLSRLQETAT